MTPSREGRLDRLDWRTARGRFPGFLDGSLVTSLGAAAAMKRLAKKSVLITGASTGVGAAAARQFAEEGANVVLVARSAGPLEAIAQEIGRHGSALAIPADVTDDAAVVALLKKAVETFGGLHVIVNNAGYNRRGDLEEISPPDLARIVDVNLKAPILLTRRALPYLRQADRGAVINVASLAGRIPVPDEAAYSAAKFGLRAFTFALAEELRGTNVTASVVSPGPIDTGFIMSDLDRVPDLVFSVKMSSAERVAAAIVKCAIHRLSEQVIPWHARYLTLAGYLCPPLARLLRPFMQWKGRKVKAKYRAKYSG